MSIRKKLTRYEGKGQALRPLSLKLEFLRLSSMYAQMYHQSLVRMVESRV